MRPPEYSSMVAAVCAMVAGVREKIGTTPVPRRIRSETAAYAINSVSESRPAMWVVYAASKPSSSASATRSSVLSSDLPGEMKAPMPGTSRAFIYENRAVHSVEQSSVLYSPAAKVWEFAVSEEGINHELSPILRMTMPPKLRGKTIDDVEVGVELGRSWILLGRLIPVDYDDLKLAELGPGMRFRESSRTLTFSVWQHEREVVDEGAGCRVTDRLGFELKRPMARVPGMAALARAVVGFLFRHRHRRLASYWALAGGSSER
jgi:ligand-binding SRPBCC domain-containing protein